MLVCEEINFELPPKIIVLNPKDGFTELDLTVCQILTCKRAANLIIVDFFYLHIITSYL